MISNKFKQFLNNSINKSRICNWLIIGCIASVNLKHKDWKRDDAIIQSDVISYYLYLPATFIYQDINLDFLDTAPDEIKSKVWYYNGPNNSRVSKMSCGLAMMFSPFFLSAHCYALNSNYPANGYSLPYRVGILVATICFLAFGLYYLRKTLNLFFPEFVTMIVCASLVFGTNMYYYSIYDPGMSHVYNFAIIIAFVYYSIKWNQAQSFKLSVILGALLGLISLTRPTNIIIALFLFFYDVKSFQELQAKIKHWLKNWKYLFLIAFIGFLVWIPQLSYWKELTGQYWYYSYQDEGFFFNHPVILRGLFGYRKGWLLYTPIMALALLGIACLRKQLSSFFLPLLLFVLLNTYIILSWWCWWYGGSYGARAFIDCYGLLGIPLAALIYAAWNKSRLVFTALFTLLVALNLFNRFQVEQYYIGSIHWDSMSKEVYWANFGKLANVSNFQQLLEPPDYDGAKKGTNR